MVNVVCFVYFITTVLVSNLGVVSSRTDPELKIGFILEEADLDSVELENALEALRQGFQIIDVKF